MASSSLNETSAIVNGPVDGVLRGPQSVLAAIPYLLGFHPRDSIVILWMRDRRICLTQRLDLIGVDVDLNPLRESVVFVAGTCAADSAVLAVYGREDETDRGWRLDLFEALEVAFEAAGVHVVDALHVLQDRWWSYLCDEPCCPPQGRAISREVSEQVAALLGQAGTAPATSREAVVGTLAGDPEAIRHTEVLVEAAISGLEDRLAQAQCPEAELEVWRDEQIAQWIPFFTGTAAFIAAEDGASWQMGELLLSLCDIRVRDTVLWHLASAGASPNTLAWLIAAVRSAPCGHVAPVATCAAICAWISGDGVRANAALDRAVADDGQYSLAWLVGQSITHGLPPSSWREIMGQLSESECRTGVHGSADPSDERLPEDDSL